MDVSENSDTPKSSISIGFYIINHPFLGTPIFGNTHIDSLKTRACLRLPYIAPFFSTLGVQKENFTLGGV